MFWARTRRKMDEECLVRSKVFRTVDILDLDWLGWERTFTWKWASGNFRDGWVNQSLRTIGGWRSELEDLFVIYMTKQECFQYKINSGGGRGGDYLGLLTSATFTEVYRSLKLCWKITIAIRTEILDAEIHSVGHSHCTHVALLGGSDGHNLCTWRS